MAKSENKTRPQDLPFSEFLAGIEDEQVRGDCKNLAKMMERLSGAKPRIWGESMVGFGQYHYKYASGREGDSFRIGFAPRKKEISIYTSCYQHDEDPLMQSLGKFKHGKSCIYIRKLSDIDEGVLEKLLLQSMQKLKELYG